MARSDLDDGLDPTARLQYRSEAYEMLSGTRIADRSDPGANHVTLEVPGVRDKGDRKGGAPLTFQQRADASALVADLLADLGAKYDLDEAFGNREFYDDSGIESLIQMLYTGIGRAGEPAAAAADTGGDAGASLPAARASRLNLANEVPDKPDLLMDGLADSTFGELSLGPSPGQYDFAAGQSDDVADLRHLEARVTQDAPPPAALDVDALAPEKVRVEEPPASGRGTPLSETDHRVFDEQVKPGAEGSKYDADDLDDIAGWSGKQGPVAQPSGNKYDGDELDDAGSWLAKQGPVVEPDGSAGWKLPGAEGTEDTGRAKPTPKPRSSRPSSPTPKPRSRPSSPTPVEGGQWPAVTGAVPESPVPGRRSPPPSIPAPPPPAETSPVPPGSTRMFGATADGKGASVGSDDLALPTGQLAGYEDFDIDDIYASPEEILGKAVSPSAADDTPPPPPTSAPPSRSGRSGSGTASAGGNAGQAKAGADDGYADPQKLNIRPSSPSGGEQTYGNVELQYANNVEMRRKLSDAPPPGEGLKIWLGRTQRDGVDLGFGLAAPARKNETVSVMGGANWQLSDNRMIIKAFDLAADEAALTGEDIRPAAEVIYVDLNWVAKTMSDKPGAGVDPFPGVKIADPAYSGKGSILPKSASTRGVQRLDGVKTTDQMRLADELFMEDLRTAGTNNKEFKGIQLRKKMAMREGESLDGYRKLFADLVTESNRKDRPKDAEKYQRYVDAIDEYQKARLAKLISLEDFRNHPMPNSYKQTFHLGGDNQSNFTMGDTLASEIREQTGKYLTIEGTIASLDAPRGKIPDGMTIGTPELKNEELPGHFKDLMENWGIDSELSQMLKVSGVMTDADGRQHMTVDILARAALDAEAGNNPLVRIDMEIAYIEDLRAKGGAPDGSYFHTRYQSLRTARDYVVAADDANMRNAMKGPVYNDKGQLIRPGSKLNQALEAAGFDMDELKLQKIQYEWEMTPDMRRALLDGNPDWRNAMPRGPNPAAAPQQVFQEPPPLPQKVYKLPAHLL